MDSSDSIDIFISYRRTDARAISRLIFEDLCRRFGREHVFFDVNRIPLAATHHRYLSEHVARSSVLLVIIGDRWAEGARAFTDDDLVRIEVRAALEAGIPILPILADGAALPLASDALDILQPLLRRQALPVDSGRDFAHQMAAVCRQVELLAGESRIGVVRRQEARSDFPATLSQAPVATRTLTPVHKRASSASRRVFLGSIWLGAAAAVVFSVLRLSSRNTAPPTALALVAPVASTAMENVTPGTISIQASASPAEATLYLDGEPLPSNPYVGRMPADGTQHLIRAEAPGHSSTNRAFVANREVAIILALARTDGQPRGEGKKVRQTTVSPPAVPVPVPLEPTTPAQDDCKVSPYYVDSRNIKVVRPECRSPIQSP